MTRYRVSPRYPAALLAVMLLLSGCASVNLNSFDATGAEEALSAAGSESDRNLAHDYLLKEADRFLARQQAEDARTILQSNQFSGASETARNQQRLLSMEAAIALEDSAWARQLASDIAPEFFLNFDRNQLSTVLMILMMMLALFFAGKLLERLGLQGGQRVLALHLVGDAIGLTHPGLEGGGQ